MELTSKRTPAASESRIRMRVNVAMAQCSRNHRRATCSTRTSELCLLLHTVAQEKPRCDRTAYSRGLAVRYASDIREHIRESDTYLSLYLHLWT